MNRLITALIICFLKLLILLPNNLMAAEADDEKFSWMNTKFDDMTTVIPECLEVPASSSIKQYSNSLAIDSDQWVAVGAAVEEGKSLNISWRPTGITLKPDKYLVLYRIDPRITVPEVFIQKYSYEEDRYKSDFKEFRGGILKTYQGNPSLDMTNRQRDYLDYFNFVGRSKITLKPDDVVNITLDHDGSFFGSKSAHAHDIELHFLSVFNMRSPIKDNQIVYSSALKFCEDAITITHPDYYKYCRTTYSRSGATSYTYLDMDQNFGTMYGYITNNSAFSTNFPNINACPANANGRHNNPLCYYDQGRGMQIRIGSELIKDTATAFVHSNFSNQDFLYHHSKNGGVLDFSTDWVIETMYNGYSPLVKDWDLSDTDPYTSVYYQLNERFNQNKGLMSMQFLHFGRYLMEIQIGNAYDTINAEKIDQLQLEYLIVESGAPDASATGNKIGMDFAGNADKSGYLWLRVLKPANSQLDGDILVKTSHYTGSTWFSNLVYDKLVQPLRAKFQELSKIIYIKLVNNATLASIAKVMLVLYVIVYGLTFLAGATQITVQDIVTRTVKIAIIVALFSETSWTFFNENLFNLFTDGAESLMRSVVGTTGQNGNIFGFIDPIFDKYTNGRMWALLFIQLLQWHNGLAFFAILTIYSLLTYFRAVLEVIISYCLAFLGLAVMVSLAPFFIILLLFERTKSIFDNWLSTMFSYMIQPTILLIFFLLIDQILSEHITGTIVEACWGILIPIKIGIDLNHIGIPLSFSFQLPFLPGIPFYVSDTAPIDSIGDFFSKSGTFITVASASLLFYTLCKFSRGLMDYVTLVVQYLTNVIAARQDGHLQSQSNPVSNIIGDMAGVAKPITSIPRRAGSFVKDKFSKQKISNTKADLAPDEKVNYQQFSSDSEIAAKQLPDKPEFKKAMPSAAAKEARAQSKFTLGGNRATTAAKPEFKKAEPTAKQAGTGDAGSQGKPSFSIGANRKRPQIADDKPAATKPKANDQKEEDQ